MTSDITHLEESVLQSIIDSLNSLKRDNGFLKDDSFWHAKDVDDGKISRKRKKISSFPNDLEEMEVIKSTLLVLMESCERKLATIQSTQGAAGDRQEGINSLPNAILANVFKFANSECEDGDMPPSLKISHVCSRFRTIASDTPSLWSLLSTQQPLGYVKECLKRTRESGLSIWLYVELCAFRPDGFSMQEQLGLAVLKSFGEKRKSIKGFLDVVCGHSRRWTSLHFILCKYADGKSITACVDRLSALDFPKLGTFEFSAYLRYFEDFPKIDVSRSWKMPNLRTLCFHDVFPTKASQFHSSKTITTVDLTWERYNENQFLRPSVQDLVDFLSSLPNLVDARLYIRWIDVDDEEDEEDNGPPIEGDAPTESFVLPRLEKLQVQLSRSAFSGFARAMQAPVLKTLALNVGPVDETVNAVPSATFRSVQELKIETWEQSKTSPDLRRILKKFPHLEHLELDAEQTPFPKFKGLGNPPMAMPPLRSLAIKTNTSVTKAFVRAFVKALKESGRWATFETLKLECKNEKGMPIDLKNLVEQGKKVINVGPDGDDSDSDDK